MHKQKSLNILIISPEYPPNNIGGGGLVFKNLATSFVNSGHRVTVIYGDYKNHGNSITSHTEKSICLYSIPEYKYPQKYPFLRTVMPPKIRVLKQTKQLIQDLNPDIVHLHAYGIPFIDIISKYLRKSRLPYVFTIHGYPKSQNNYNIFIQTIWNLYDKLFTQPTLKGAEAITGCSNYILADDTNKFKDKSTTVYNGIDVEKFTKTPNTTIDIKKENSIPEEARTIYSIGRIHEMKGLHEVIKKLPELNKSGYTYYYLIAGEDDGYKNDLIKLAKRLNVEKYVKYLGFHTFEQKVNYINQCDIYTVPSLWEPFGLVVLEGAIFNKPILTTDIGGIKEILKGYPRKINIYSDTLINDIEEVIKNDNPNTQYDISRFSWDKIANQYLKLLQKHAK